MPATTWYAAPCLNHDSYSSSCSSSVHSRNVTLSSFDPDPERLPLAVPANLQEQHVSLQLPVNSYSGNSSSTWTTTRVRPHGHKGKAAPHLLQLLERTTATMSTESKALQSSCSTTPDAIEFKHTVKPQVTSPLWQLLFGNEIKATVSLGNTSSTPIDTNAEETIEVQESVPLLALTNDGDTSMANTADTGTTKYQTESGSNGNVSSWVDPSDSIPALTHHKLDAMVKELLKSVDSNQESHNSLGDQSKTPETFCSDDLQFIEPFPDTADIVEEWHQEEQASASITSHSEDVSNLDLHSVLSCSTDPESPSISFEQHVASYYSDLVKGLEQGETLQYQTADFRTAENLDSSPGDQQVGMMERQHQQQQQEQELLPDCELNEAVQCSNAAQFPDTTAIGQDWFTELESLLELDGCSLITSGNTGLPPFDLESYVFSSDSSSSWEATYGTSFTNLTLGHMNVVAGDSGQNKDKETELCQA